MTSHNASKGYYSSIGQHHDEGDAFATENKPGSRIRQLTSDSDELRETKTNARFGVQDGKPSLTRHERWMDRANDIWAWEVGAMCVSLACFGVVIWMLVYLDGTPLRVWKSRIKPNALLSIFITISKSSMLCVIAACIAQLRWLYYESAARNLYELDTFDDASRGPWGSALFIFGFRFGNGKVGIVASLGALITVLALAVDPFAQQVLFYETKSTVIGPDINLARIPATKSHQEGQSLLFDPGVDMRKALYGGILNFDYPINFTCHGEQCQWPKFYTLGTCGRCEDVAHTAEISCAPNAGTLNDTCTELIYSIPSVNLSIALQNGSLPTGGLPGVDRRYTLVQSAASDHYPSGLLDPTNFRFLLAQLLVDVRLGEGESRPLGNPSWNVTLCAIEWCAKIYEDLRYDNGGLKNFIPREIMLRGDSDSSCVASMDCQDLIPQDVSQVPGFPDMRLRTGVSNDSFDIRRIMNFTQDMVIANGALDAQAKLSSLYSVASTMFWNMNITAAVQHVAATITNFQNAVSGGQADVAGTVVTSETYVNVSWPWFSLPAGLFLSSAAFLIVVIVMSKHDTSEPGLLWKTSTVPLLIKGLEGWDRSMYQGADSRRTIDATARTIRARLKRNSRGEMAFVHSHKY